MEQRLAAPPTGPKPGTRVPCDSVPGRPRPPKRLKPRAAGSASQAQSGWNSRLRASQAPSQLAARVPCTKPLARVPKPKAAGSTSCVLPKQKAAVLADQGLIACQEPHLQRLPNTCAQRPARPTSSLGQRQNTQQRGAAGIGETAG